MRITWKPFKPSKALHTVEMLPELEVRGSVLDDQTGEPITAFQVIPGTTNGRGKRPQNWHRHDTIKASDGSYAITIDSEYEAHAIRVEADGYQPATSRAIRSDEGQVTLDFRLTRGGGVRGAVLAPDGSPEANANVILGTVADRPYIRANGESLGQRGFSKRTDKDGRFQFGPQDADFTVFVFGKSGFAHLAKSKFEDTEQDPKQITLLPWARIEGAIAIVTNRQSNDSNVKLEFTGAMGGQSFFGQHCFFDYQAKVDANGKFVFERVPPDTEVTIYQTVSIRHGSMTQVGRGASATFALKQGQTREIHLGMKGRTVTGHLEVDADVEVEWGSIMGTLTPSKPLQDGDVSHNPTGHFRIQKKGDFRIESVPPGTYRLFVRATTPRASLHEQGEMIGDINQTVSVPAAENEDDNDPHDLGTLTIQPSNRREWASPKTAKMSAVLPAANELAGEKRKPSNLNLAIIDSSGKSISDATVKAWFVSSDGVEQSSVRPSQSGTVELNEIPPHGAWVFASAPGYRFGGGYFAGDASNLKLVLEQNDEQSTPVLTDSPLSIDDATRRVLQTTVRALAEAIMEAKDERIKFQLERFLAEYDPEFALETHAANTIDFAGFTQDADNFSNWHHSVVLSFVAREVAKDDPAQAEQVIESIEDRGKRVWAYSEAVKALLGDGEVSAETRQRVLSWLTKVHEDARETEKSHERAENLSRIAKHFIAIQEDELASEVFQEAVEAARIPSNDERAIFSRSFTARQLAPHDLDTALELVSELLASEQLSEAEMRQMADKMSHSSDNRERERLREQLSAIHTRDRAIGNIAHQIAATNPDKSEELLAVVGPQHDDYAVRVCYRMATRDVHRARALADNIQDPVYRGVAAGVIAEVLSNEDTAAAKSLMREAFEQFEIPRDSDQSRHLTPVKAAVSLLPSIEKVDPAMVRHYMWKALSLRGKRTCNSGCVGPVCQLGTTNQDQKLRISDALLGAVLARYDREIARNLAFAPGDETLDLAFDEAPYFLFGASTLLDPKATIEAAAKMPQETPYQQRTKLAALQQILPLISKDTKERWNWFMDEQFQVWRIDKLDL